MSDVFLLVLLIVSGVFITVGIVIAVSGNRQKTKIVEIKPREEPVVKEINADLDGVLGLARWLRGETE